MARTVALLLACTLAAAGTAAAGGSRKLLVGGQPDARWDPRNTDASRVTGQFAQYTVPGTDIFVVDTSSRTGGAAKENAVLSNQIEAQVRQGDTHSYLGTMTTTRVTGNLDADSRSSIGGNDQHSLVGNAAGGDGRSIYAATQAAHGNAMATIRGNGKELDVENRATLAKMDASSAIQMVTRGMEANSGHATRVGSASANAVQAPDSYYWVFVPTWWRR